MATIIQTNANKPLGPEDFHNCRFCQDNKRHTHYADPQPLGLKPLKRYKMISELKKFCDEGEKAFLRPSEEFHGQESGTGIWTGGEGEPSKDGMGLWNYWEQNHPEIDQFLADRGWYQEWYDCGTVMLYPI